MVISVIVGLLLAALGLFMLLSGRGSFLIAGFNTMSKEEKEKYDSNALCKFVGKIILPIGIAILSVFIGGLLDSAWFAIGFVVLTIGVVIFAVVYSNTGNRFKK